jgi:hypothetical protein
MKTPLDFNLRHENVPMEEAAGMAPVEELIIAMTLLEKQPALFAFLLFALRPFSSPNEARLERRKRIKNLLNHRR